MSLKKTRQQKGIQPGTAAQQIWDADGLSAESLVSLLLPGHFQGHLRFGERTAAVPDSPQVIGPRCWLGLVAVGCRCVWDVCAASC